MSQKASAGRGGGKAAASAEGSASRNDRNEKRGKGGAGPQGKGAAPRMNDEKEQKKLNDIKDKIAALKKEQDEISKKVDEKRAQQEKLGKDKAPTREELKKLREKRGELVEQIKLYREKQEQSKNLVKSKREALNAARDKLPLRKNKEEEEAAFLARNYSYFDNKIKDIEDHVARTQMSLLEEKKALHDIQLLNKEKKLVEEYEKIYEKTTAEKESADYRPQIKDISDQLDKLKLEEAALEEKFKGFDEKYGSFKGEIDALFNRRKECSEQIKLLRKEFDQEKAALDEKWKKWKEEQTVRRAREQEERKKRQAEMEEKRKIWEEEKKKEEALRVPYEQEVALCDALITTLNSMKANAKKKNAKITHEWHTFLSFEKVSVNPPTTFAEVDTTVTAIQKKKDHYLLLRQKKLEAKEREASNPAANSTSNGDSAKVDASSENESVVKSENTEEKAAETESPSNSEEEKGEEKSEKAAEEPTKESESDPVAVTE